VEHCQLYGTRGQEQSGIDLYGRKSGASQYTVYQCKRVRHFGPARIKAAVTTFLKGDWVGKTETLVLCTSESLVSKDRADEIEKQHERLQGSGVSLIPWDVDVLCEKLKAHPDLVHDFFGNAWVRSFVGEEAAKRLGRRLEPRQVLRLRQRLAEFYRRIFDTQDPGLPGDPGTRDEPLLLEHRFVVPDIADLRQDVLQPIQGAGLRSSGDVAYAPGDDTSSPWLDKLPREAGRGRQEIIASIRQPIPTWLARASRNVVLGLPGSGKSSLLRFLALDLLSQEPRLALFAQRWGQHIPVWIPFALWTRLIDSPQGEFRSLPDLLREWFHRWHEDALWPLVEEALRDGRLLLLVDGLDEWTSEAAAGIALDLLKSFVEQLDIPVVVTSRPHAYRQLGAQVLGWQEGELCGFTAAQQHSLAVTWFRHRELQLQAMGGAGGTTSAELAGRADARSTEFIREIQGSPDLRDLAEVPLLLALLIVFKFKGVHLPQHRFGVYAELVKHLAAVHPQRRQRAAAVSPVQGFPLGEDDFEKVLAKLAFTLHEQHGEGSIAANEAAGVIEAYLRDEDEGLGFSRREAHETAARLLETCQNTAGLLVRRTQTEVAFFHRTFGEYLAAAYIAGLPLDSRAEFVASRCADAAWREVILGLFWLTRAQEELRLYLERIEHTGLSRVQRYAADLILYEAAFGSFNCPVSDARRIAERAFECVEYDLWMPHRERVLDLVLGGLRSTRVRERVKAKITQWFPCYSARRNALYDIVSRWERSPETIECLWRGLHDEQTDNQRAAGKALLRHAGQDDEVANKVARLASDGADPMIKAAALEALLFGRPDYPELGELIEAARKSFSPELRLVAIMGKIQRAEQTEQDRKELMRLGSDFTRIDYRWRDEIPTALMRGWPGCPRILDACFQALDQRAGMHDHPIHRELAGYILLAGYAENPKVVQYCVDQLSKAEHPFIFLDHEHWKLLRDGFRDRPEIATAIDAWMENDDHRDSVMLSHAAMVCRTENAKRMLLSATDASRRMDHLTARALLEGWGMADPEVAAKLREVAFGPESEAGYIAYLLPDIIQDKVACRARLLQIFQQPECARPEFVIDGLARLGDTRGD
ncbi:MAG TPA: NACHT domain-containing protein, partial [Candidatus Binatia bacterium]|nr:NACHT domain-containing protein [Candidatus Binatia bacterium]